MNKQECVCNNCGAEFFEEDAEIKGNARIEPEWLVCPSCGSEDFSDKEEDEEDGLSDAIRDLVELSSYVGRLYAYK